MGPVAKGMSLGGKKGAGLVLLTALLLLAALPAPARADTALTVQVEIAGQATAVASLSATDLAALPQSRLRYSSLDATLSPVVIVAEGFSVDALISSLAIPAADLTGIKLASSDGWQRSFDAAAYLRATRYYYPGIVDGYLADATNPPQFAAGTEDNKQSVAAILALKSYEGLFDPSPDSSLLSASDGIRFCFGQTAITDTPLLSYGKHINRIVLVLKDNTGYVPSAASETTAGDSDAAASGGEAEDLENEGLRADTLTITVGYFGGDYYTKKVFSLADLQAMSQVKQVYSYIDNMPAVCLDSAVGVRLSDILEAAGIDINSVQCFHFYCSDVARTWYLSLTKGYLLDTIRYYYPNLPSCWDYDEAEATPGAMAGAVQVETIIGLEDNWRRFATAADFAALAASTRFRLLFGQTDTSTPTSSYSAKWVHTIAVTLGGTSPKGITLDASELELEVGSIYQLNATLDIFDDSTDHGVLWSSSDANVVYVNSRGEIKVLKEGEATITATTSSGGLTASVRIKAVKDAAETAVSGGDADQGGDVYQIDGGEAQPTDSAGGGTQQWRVYEMSETAIALADIDEGVNPLAWPAALAAVLLFCGGVAAELFYYFRQL